MTKRIVRPFENCRRIELHTPMPEGYLEWHEWADKKAKTHEQVQCPECGYWVIWKPKKQREPIAMNKPKNTNGNH